MDYLDVNYDLLVHDDVWYTLFATSDTLHLRVGDATSDTLTWRFDGVRFVEFRVLGVHQGKLLFLYFPPSPRTVMMYSVDIQTFAWFDVEILNHGYRPVGVDHVFRNGTLHLLLDKSGASVNSYELWYHRYDVTNHLPSQPIRLWSTANASFSMFDFDVDSEGNVHLLLEREVWRLVKLTPDGHVLDRTDLKVNPDDPRNPRGKLFLVLNGTDCPHVMGWMYHNTTSNGLVMSFVLDNEHEVSPVRKTVYEGVYNLGPYEGNNLGTTDGDNVLFCLRILEDDSFKILYTCKIPPAPDLSVDPSGFSYMEQKGTERPVVVSVRVTNEGRVDATSFITSFYTRAPGSTSFEPVDLAHHEVTIPPGGSTTVMHALRLPQGGNTLRIVIHDVSPREDRVLNNVIEVLVFVSANNPPTIRLTEPTNGTLVDDVLFLKGVTEDLDDGQTHTTMVEGLPGPSASVNGTGEWELSLDVSAVGSGDYVLTLRAHDGIDYSGPVLLLVRIDHPEETFLLSSFEPDGDGTVLTGQVLDLFLNVTDLFSRPVEYQWSQDGTPVGRDTPYHVFMSDFEGRYEMRVVATNGRATLEHTWTVTVRDPRQPSIISYSPASDVIHVERGDKLDFTIQVYNPDSVPYEVQWQRGAVLLSEGDGLSITVPFDVKGTHVLLATVKTLAHSESVEWRVVMNNTAPDITGTTPSSPVGTLRVKDVLVLSVVASDEDGDTLSYTWSSDDIPISTSNVSFLSITLMEEMDAEGSITVTVSDGEDSTTATWEIGPVKEALDGPVDPQGNGLLVGITILIIVVAIVGALLILNQHRMRKSD